MPRVFRTDVERGMPPILREVLFDGGWLEYDEEMPPEEQPAFSLWWRTNRFTASQIASAKYPLQRINHYPKSSEITKKDHLFRHLRRMRVVHGTCYDFSPVTFGLPNDYVKFCQFFSAEREKYESAVAALKAKGEQPDGVNLPLHAPTYICKPSDMSRGRKIFVFRDIAELTYDCSSVVQRYIERPLLIHGHKVDFRVYVLVTSFQPLRAYIYDDLLGRFSVERYDLANVTNIFCHLTNYSVNKNSDVFEQYKKGIGMGCKWHGAQIREHFEKFGIEWSLMWQRVEALVCYTLLSIAPQVTPVPQCFELYGFDIMFDESFKPWLIEVNFSPALAVEGDVDDTVKRSLMTDMIATLNIPEAGASTDSDTAGAAPAEEPESAPVPAPPPPTQQRKPAAAAPASSVKRTTSNLGPSGRPRAAGGSAPSATTAAKSRVAQVQSSASSDSAKRRSASAATTSSAQRRATPPPGSVTYVDSPKGKFRWCFPFNETTEQLSVDLTRRGAPVEQILRSCISEVKRREQKVAAQMASYPERYGTKAGVGHEMQGPGAQSSQAAASNGAGAKLASSTSRRGSSPPQAAPSSKGTRGDAAAADSPLSSSKAGAQRPAESKTADASSQREPAARSDDVDDDDAALDSLIEDGSVDLSAVEALIAEARRMGVS